MAARLDGGRNRISSSRTKGRGEDPDRPSPQSPKGILGSPFPLRGFVRKTVAKRNSLSRYTFARQGAGKNAIAEEKILAEETGGSIVTLAQSTGWSDVQDSAHGAALNRTMR